MAHSALYKRIMNSQAYIVVRNKKRLANPYCELCLLEGKTVLMADVHHLTEIESARTDAEAWELALAWSNLQSLCKEHHHAVHEGSHTKAAHKKRQADRMQQWIALNAGSRS